MSPYMMIGNPDKRSENAIPTRSKTELAYQRIKEAIKSAQLRPGELLSEQKLSEDYAMSRTPIREALRRLQSEGMIMIIPDRGTFVQRLQSGDIKEIFFLRDLLETAALRQSIDQITPQQLMELEELIERDYLPLSKKNLADITDEDKQVLYMIDKKLHRLISYECFNSRLIIFLETLWDQMEIIRNFSVVNPARFKESYEEHKEIFLALKARDLQRTEKALHFHLQNVMENSIMVAENLDRYLR